MVFENCTNRCIQLCMSSIILPIVCLVRVSLFSSRSSFSSILPPDSHIPLFFSSSFLFYSCPTHSLPPPILSVLLPIIFLFFFILLFSSSFSSSSFLLLPLNYMSCLSMVSYTITLYLQEKQDILPTHGSIPRTLPSRLCHNLVSINPIICVQEQPLVQA